MADLSVLIRLHKHELDEKRQALAALYGDLALMERERRALEDEFAREKKEAEKMEEVHYTFAAYAETVQKRREEMDRLEAELSARIDVAKESLMETFGELKKYEMTQEERDRLAEEERRIRESKMMDDIGLEGYRRRSDEG